MHDAMSALGQKQTCAAHKPMSANIVDRWFRFTRRYCPEPRLILGRLRMKHDATDNPVAVANIVIIVRPIAATTTFGCADKPKRIHA
jgi:hypothetical protein